MKLSFASRAASLAVAGSLLALALLPLASRAFAQDAGGTAADGTTGRETGFVAMTGPATESVSGGNLMIAAYATIWVLLCGYVGRLALLQSGTAKELARLEAAMRTRDEQEASAKPSEPAKKPDAADKPDGGKQEQKP